MTKIKAVIFDLDGTLADTLATLAFYCNKTLEHLGLPGIDVQRYRYLVGRGAQVLMEEMLLCCGRNPSAKLVSEMLADFNSMYMSDTMYLTEPYKGVPGMLKSLKQRGLKLAVFSNKPDAATQVVVRTLFDEVFDFVLGKRQEFPRKPEPDGALFAARSMNVGPKECLYVGDTDTDMQTGNAAGMITAGVLWGFRDEDELRANNAAYIINEPMQIPEIIEDLNNS